MRTAHLDDRTQILAKTFITVPGFGQSTFLPAEGTSVLRFIFRDRPDELSAFAEVAGFIDSLLATVDVADGFTEFPVAGPIRFKDAGKHGVDATFDLAIAFDDGLAVEEWVESAGIVDDEFVELILGPVTWLWDEDSLTDALVDARMEAVVDAVLAAGDYAQLLKGGRGIATLVEAEELDSVVSFPSSDAHEERPSLGDALTPTNPALITVEVNTKFRVRKHKK